MQQTTRPGVWTPHTAGKRGAWLMPILVMAIQVTKGNVASEPLLALLIHISVYAVFGYVFFSLFARLRNWLVFR